MQESENGKPNGVLEKKKPKSNGVIDQGTTNELLEKATPRKSLVQENGKPRKAEVRSGARK